MRLLNDEFGLYKLDLDSRQKKLLTEEAIDFIENWVNASENCPKWERAYICFAEKDGLYVSLAEQEEFSQTIPWNKFEECILGQDYDLIERYLPKFKVLLAKMEEKIAVNKC